MTESLRKFEQEAIAHLCGTILSEPVLARIFTDGDIVSVDHTGVGYLLTLRHAALPTERYVASTPLILGVSGEFRVGFLVFLENNELTLECHNAGEADGVPTTVRDLPIVLYLGEPGPRT